MATLLQDYAPLSSQGQEEVSWPQGYKTLLSGSCPLLTLTWQLSYWIIPL